jgi:hypothetical protein
MGMVEALSEDRRRQDRKFLTFFAQVSDRRNGMLLGYLVDLTTGGALLIGELPLARDEIFPIRMDLPEGFADKDRLELDVRAVWNSPDVDPGLYRTGLRLINPSGEDLNLLVKLLDKYARAKAKR